MWVCYYFLYDPGPEPPMSVLQLKENFNSECQCPSHLRPVTLPLSSLQLRLQSLHVRPVDVRPVALTLVLLCNCFFNESKRQR